MAIQALIPYALAAYGGYKGYRGAKKSGASGLQSILAGAAGAYTGYNLGSAGMSAAGQDFTKFSQLGNKYPMLSILPGQAPPGVIPSPQIIDDPTQTQGGSILDILKSKNTKGDMAYDPLKVSTAIAGGTFLSGAFNQEPVDTYSPGYNMGYLDMKNQRPGYTYIDPETGQERAYEKIYSPEESGIGDPRVGPYSYNVQKFNTGGITNIKKFNEGGVNYLPSKVSHDENDSNNYVRASGYVEDGEGVGDKDEDTMLAQLADGEFVTRADGVLGAGIIAGGNPNSMKDMREKGAQYFYEQQKRYKRVFDLLKDINGIGKEKTN
jgi:hypothetical protein